MSENRDVVAITCDLIKLRSLSGDESSVVEYICELLRQWKIPYELLPVEEGSCNIFACAGQPRVVLSTHMDVVPAPDELFVPALRDDRIVGRGACDAKGILAAMLCAGKAIWDRGERDFGFLFVVSEESGGAGARAASKALANRNIRWIVNGEPTEGRLMRGHKGTVDCTVRTVGKSCHSGYPELGENAINRLMEVLNDIEKATFAKDPVLGATTVNIGQITGGVAANVLAPEAQAHLLFRTVGPATDVLNTLSEVIADRAQVLDIDSTEPVHLNVLPGYSTGVASFCTDIPNLLSLGAEFLLYSPGSIHNAHTDNEFIRLDDLHDAVIGFESLVTELLRKGTAREVAHASS